MGWVGIGLLGAAVAALFAAPALAGGRHSHPGQTLQGTLLIGDPITAAGEKPVHVIFVHGMRARGPGNLDLIVTTADGREFHGNIAPRAARFDRTNIVEKVSIAATPAGAAAVTVRSYRSVQPQSYALVTCVSKL